MFERLSESARPAERRRAMGVGVLSIALHTALITGAVYATMEAKEEGPVSVVDTTVIYEPPVSGPTLAPPDAFGGVPMPPIPLVSVVPTGISVPRPTVTFDPRDFTPDSTPDGTGSGTGRAARPFPALLVQDPPELLAGAPPEYPPLLRTAGIEGRVVLRFVVDTLGRVERSSIRVVESDDPGFERAAERFAMGARFRPGRQYGRAVRVLVVLPVQFAIGR